VDPIADEPRDADWEEYDDRPTDATDVVGKRLGAFLVDFTICVLALVGPLLLFGATFSSPRLESRSPDISRANGDIAIFARDRAIVFAKDEIFLTAAIAGLVALLVFVLLPAFTGSSPGKAVGDIRVVRRDGRRPGLLRSIIRTLFWIIDGIPGLPLVGYAIARITRRHQRLGDLVARTYVVDKAHYGRPVDEPLHEEADAAETSGWMADVEPVTAKPSVSGVSVFGEADPAALDREPGLGEDATAPAASAWAPAAAAATAPPEPSPVPAQAPAAPAAQPQAQGEGEGGQFKADEPVWDQRRRTYIMYDSRRGAWLGWDDTANEWRRLGSGDG